MLMDDQLQEHKAVSFSKKISCSFPQVNTNLNSHAPKIKQEVDFQRRLKVKRL